MIAGPVRREQHPSPAAPPDPCGILERIVEVTEGLSCSELAALTGLHPENIRRTRNGGRVSAGFVAALAEAFGVRIDWLLLGRGPRFPLEEQAAQLRSATPRELFGALTRKLCASGLRTPPDKVSMSSPVGSGGMDEAPLQRARAGSMPPTPAGGSARATGVRTHRHASSNRSAKSKELRGRPPA